jgi:hypothetical protein
MKVRFGVVYPDGRKATSLDPMPVGDKLEQESAIHSLPPVLRHSEHGANSGHMRWRSHHELWLWPLPAAEPFDLFMEWPALEIPLAQVSIDGAAIQSVANRSQEVWA